jgi:hypothetical protein
MLMDWSNIWPGKFKEFRKRVFVKVPQEIKAKELEQAKGEMGCREEVPRYLFSRLGLIRFERHKVKYQEKDKLGFFLDEILALKPSENTRLTIGFTLVTFCLIALIRPTFVIFTSPQN